MNNATLHAAKTQHMAAPKQVQPRLEVNEPGDSFEQEADALADRVMQTQGQNNNAQVQPATGLIGRSVQRKCAQCEEEEKNKLRRKTGGAGGTTVSSSFVSSLQASKAGGTALPASTRGHMENAFGADFSGVRIHTGSEAAAMNTSIQAKAFTYGNDIYFNKDEYSSDTDQGKRLLAHELTHVVQQQKTIPAIIRRQGEEPSKKQVQRDDYLRRLSVWPDEAHYAWRSLKQGEQDIVVTYMTMRYGSDFASEFFRYTKLKKKPDPVATYTNVLTETHQQLYARGYRLVNISLGIENWVHPSGYSIHRILPSKPSGAQPTPTTPDKSKEEEKTYEYGGVTYDKKTGKVTSYPKSMEARCMLPCLNNTQNADDCADCCVEKIPANDDGCMNFCITSCQDYFD